MKKTYILRLIGICLALLVSDQAKSFDSNDIDTGTQCISNGLCDDMIQCPYNRACFNNCDIGFDPTGTAVVVGNFFASIIGLSKLAESDYQVICRNNCVANIVNDCKKPQPIDITTTPPSKDPARNCREYCGAALKDSDSRFGKCEGTCRNFDPLAKCYAENANNDALGVYIVDPTQKKGVCDYNQYIPQNAEFQNNKENVKEKMTGLAMEALCLIKPEAYGCGSKLCEDHPWSRVCTQHQAELSSKMKQKKAQQEKGTIDYSDKATGDLAGVAAGELATKIAAKKALASINNPDSTDDQ